MRPLVLPPIARGEYDPEAVLAAPAADGDGGASTAAVVEELAALPPPAGAAEAALRAARLGEGHQAARAALLARTEAFCALCDVPVLSGARVVRVLPAGWFPRRAFAADNLLLACPACAAARGERPVPGSGEDAEVARERLLRPETVAWPHRLAEGAGPGALLPFRPVLVESRCVGGQPRRGRTVPPREWAALREGWRGGGARARAGGVDVELSGGGTRGIALWLEPVPGPGEAGVEALIGLAALNGVVAAPDDAWTDRRVELRTLAFLRALDLADRLERAHAAGAAEVYDALLDLLRDAAEGTGFWVVWLHVLRGLPDAQALLREVRAGTAPVRWTAA